MLNQFYVFLLAIFLINFELDDFNKQIKDAVTKYVKGVITNIPADKGIPVLQMERKLLEINEIVAAYLKPRLENDFGVNIASNFSMIKSKSPPTSYSKDSYIFVNLSVVNPVTGTSSCKSCSFFDDVKFFISDNFCIIYIVKN